MATRANSRKKRNRNQKIDLSVHVVESTGKGKKESETNFGTENETSRRPSQGASPNPEKKRPTIKSMKHKVAKTFGFSSTSRHVAEDQISGTEEDLVPGPPQIAQLSCSPEGGRKQSSDRPESDPSDTTADCASQDSSGLCETEEPLFSDTPISPSESNPRSSGASSEEHQAAGISKPVTEESGSMKKESAAQKLLTAKLSENNRLKDELNKLQKALRAEEKDCRQLRIELQAKVEQQSHQTQLEAKLTKCKGQLATCKQTIADQYDTKVAQLVSDKEFLASQLKSETAKLEKENHELLKKFVKVQDDLTRSSENLEDKEKSHADAVRLLTEELQATKLEIETQKQREVENVKQKLVKDHQEDIEKKNFELVQLKNENQIEVQELNRRVQITKQEIETIREQKEAELRQMVEEVNEKKTEIISQKEELEKWKSQYEDEQKKHLNAMHELNERLQATKQEVEELKDQKHLRSQQDEQAVDYNEEGAEFRIKFDEEVQQKVSQQVAACLAEERAKFVSEIEEQYKIDHERDVQLAVEKEQSKLKAEIQKLKKIIQSNQEQLARSAYLHQEETGQLEIDEKQPQPTTVLELTNSESQTDTMNLEITDLKAQIETLCVKLVSQQDLYHNLQSDFEHLKEKYGQLEVQAMAKMQLSSNTIASEGDTSEMFFPQFGPSTPVQTGVSSSFMKVANQLLQFVDCENLVLCTERTLDSKAALSSARLLGLPEQHKQFSYVFAVFSASQCDHSTVLDYTPRKQVVDHPLQDKSDHPLQDKSDHPLQDKSDQQNDSDDDDEFHSIHEEEEEEDNRTDAQKLEESRKETENLRESITKLTLELEEVKSSNKDLQEAVDVALRDTPVSQTGVVEGDDAVKKVAQMKGMYFQQLTKTMKAQTAQRELRTQLNEEMSRLKIKLSKSEKTNKDLTKKIQENIREIKSLRPHGAKSMYPPTSASESMDENLPADSPHDITDLKKALRERDEAIEALQLQVKSFESKSTQLEQNSKLQSTKVLNLKRNLETVEAELKLAEKKDGEIMIARQELAKLQEEKNTFEDERSCWKREMNADKDNIQNLKKELADIRIKISVTPSELLKPQVVEEDEKEREIKLLQSDVISLKVEAEDNKRKVERTQKDLAEIERQRSSLERKLQKVSEERDTAQNGVMELKVSNREWKTRAIDVGKQLDVTLEHAASLSKTVEELTTVNNELKEERKACQDKIKNLEEDLSVVKIQALQYVEDFQTERRDRENAVGARDNQRSEFSVEIQKLSAQLCQERLNLENEKKERQALIKKLEESVIETQTLTRQLQQAEEDFTGALKAKSVEMDLIKADKAQVMGQMEHFRAESSRLKQQRQKDEQIYEQRKTEFIHQIQMLKKELQEKAGIITAQSRSCDGRIKEISTNLKAKEKELEILANEKLAVEERLARELAQTKQHSKKITETLDTTLAEKEALTETLDTTLAEKDALVSELSDSRKSGERIASELQESRQRLETAIVDTERLHDEVLAKTAQVKQYKKQTDNFKLKLEESNNMLLKTQNELKRCQALIKTMEDDYQDQIEQARLSAKSEKLTAETQLNQASRRIETLERQVRSLSTEGGQEEALRLEIEKREEMETRLNAKYRELIDKCDSRYQAIEKLTNLLSQHQIPIPHLNIDKVAATPGSEQLSNKRPPIPVSSEGAIRPQNECYNQDHTLPSRSHQQHLVVQQNPMQSISRTAPHSIVQQASPPQQPRRVQDDGSAHWEQTYQDWGGYNNPQGQQIPPTSRAGQAQPSSSGAQPHRINTEPPLRAKDPNAQDREYPKSDPFYHGDPHHQQKFANPNYQHQGGFTPDSQRRHNNQYPPTSQGGQYAPSSEQGYYNQEQQHAVNHPGYQQHAQPVYFDQQSGQPQYEQYPQNQAFGVDMQYYNQQGGGHNQPSNTPYQESHQPPGQPHPSQVAPTQGSGPSQQKPVITPRKTSNESPPTVPGSPPKPKRRKQNSDVQENTLLEGIDQDIKDAAEYVQEGEVLESMAPEAPFDPNLICPLCMRNFRVGEIQKYKKHVNTCQG